MYIDVVSFDESGFDLGFVNYKVEILTELKQLKKIKNGTVVIFEGSTNEINRQAMETGRVDILLSPEKHCHKDFMHHRNSGLNQVLCNIANKKKTAIGISLNDLLYLENRGQRMGRIMQNVKLCKKYKVKLVFASFAKDKFGQRPVKDMLAIAKTLGMTDKQAKESLEALAQIINNKKVLFIAKGVKLVK
ncbi:MAG: RNase P subunit p30 family protein [archaeon]